MANYDGTPSVKRQRTDGGDSSSQRMKADDDWAEGNSPTEDFNSSRSESGQPAFYNYSTNQRQSRGGNEEEKVNHVLLMTVLNPAYPITVDVIHTICSPNGQVLRIVIFKKNGVQAMVEFDSIESAKRAKQSLHGADIYSGCCTLKIEYAKPARLNVYRNDNDSWDYTNPPHNSSSNKTPDRPRPLLQEPSFGSAPTPYRGDQGRGPQNVYNSDRNDSFDGYSSGGGPNDNGRFPPQYGQFQEHYGNSSQDRYGPSPNSGLLSDPFDHSMQQKFPKYGSRSEGYDGRSDGTPTSQRYGSPTGPGGNPQTPQQGAVMMVYGLCHEKINSERIFNLFCLYGNVVRVKFLKSKEGCAMVQMGDAASVNRAIQNLNNCYFFGTKMQLGYSKQAFLNDVQQPFNLPDGSPSFKDYMGNRNNRFTNPEAASKNRIQPPSRILHFFNTPSAITEDELKKVFEDVDVKPPKTVKMFASKNPGTERSSSGLLEWENVSDALEALVTTNHTAIPNPNGKFPFILKLCFSSSGPRGM